MKLFIKVKLYCRGDIEHRHGKLDLEKVLKAWDKVKDEITEDMDYNESFDLLEELAEIFGDAVDFADVLVRPDDWSEGITSIIDMMKALQDGSPVGASDEETIGVAVPMILRKGETQAQATKRVKLEADALLARMDNWGDDEDEEFDEDDWDVED